LSKQLTIGIFSMWGKLNLHTIMLLHNRRMSAGKRMVHEN
jgi:hypothetical protein